MTCRLRSANSSKHWNGLGPSTARYRKRKAPIIPLPSAGADYGLCQAHLWLATVGPQRLRNVYESERPSRFIGFGHVQDAEAFSLVRALQAAR